MTRTRTRSWPARIFTLSVVGFLLSIYAWWPMFWSAPGTPELDGRYCYHAILIAKQAFRHWHEWPTWNPYDCHGIALWDHPEGMAGSVLLMALLPFNAMATYYLWNLLHMTAGWVGMWLLARDEYNFSRVASFASACMWAFGCCHTTQYCGAHEPFAVFWLFPLQLLLWRRAENSYAAAVGLGIVYAFFVLDGTTYPLPLTLLVLIFDAAIRSWPPSRLLKILRAGSIVGVVSIGLSAARLLPLLDQMSRHRRMVVDVDSLAHWNTIGAMWMFREVNWLLGMSYQQYVWGEYLSYIGFASVLVTLMGMWIAAEREKRLFILAGMVFLVMLGHFASWAPWTILHKWVPPFTGMRVPSRFRLIFQAFIALFVGLAVDHVPRIRRDAFQRPLTIAILALTFIGIGDMIGFGYDIINTRFHGPPPAPVTESPNFYYGGPEISTDFADSVRQNRGWLGCRSYEWPTNYEAAVWSGDVPQARVTDGEAAHIDTVTRTSSTFHVDVDVKRPTTILLNSAYAEGWQTSAGVVGEHKQLLAVQLPPGYHKLEIRYWPRRLTVGIWMTALSVLGVIAFFVIRRFRARRATR